MDEKNSSLGVGILIGVLALIGILVLALIFINAPQQAGTGNFLLSESNTAQDFNEFNKTIVYFFWGDGCPHCAAEKPFLEKLKQKYGDKIDVKMFEVWHNKETSLLFSEIAKAYVMEARGVPTTFIGEKKWIGYSDSMSTEIESYVQYCIKNKCETPSEIGVAKK